MRSAWFNIILISLVLGSCSERQPVDLIVHNATIYTVDEVMSKSEAMAIKDGRIEAIGPEHEIMNGYTADAVVDAKQQFVYPGFIDAHSHFLGYGIEKQRLDLVGTTSFKEVIDRIAAYIEDTDEKWILGRGWDQNDWASSEFPTNDTLDLLFPDRFIAVKRVDGHAYYVSSNVMELAGLHCDSDIEGGMIYCSDSRPTGVALDEAMGIIESVIPAPTRSFKEKSFKLAEKDCFGVGLTAVCDAGLPIKDIDLLDSLHSTGLKMRVYAMYSASEEVRTSLGELGIENDKLRAKSVKVYADGALGSRGAYLKEDYSDAHEHRGFLITPADSISKWATVCHKHGYQLNVHCIGDEAVRTVLEKMSLELGGTNDLRWRIEHSQVVEELDIDIYGQFNIIPSVQPTHATSDMYWAEQRLGKERIDNAYRLRTLLNQNGLLPLGTDFPVEGISPLNTFYAATVRKDHSGYPETGFNPDEKLTREEALKGITIWAAIANFQDSMVGSLEVDKFADFVILNQDIVTCPEDALLDTEVQMTFSNGKMVYEK